jgi:hypothetical protein
LRRPISRLAVLGLFSTGAILFMIGQVEADHDYRYHILAIGGLCLEIAGIVGSIRYRNTRQDRQVELWAPQKNR